MPRRTRSPQPLDYANATTRVPRRDVRLYAPWLAASAALCSLAASVAALMMSPRLGVLLWLIIAGPVAPVVALSRRFDVGRPLWFAFILTPVLYAAYVLWLARTTRPRRVLVCVLAIHVLGVLVPRSFL